MCKENFDPKDLDNQVTPRNGDDGSSSQTPTDDEGGNTGGNNNGGSNNGGSNNGGTGNGSGNGNGNGTTPPDPFWGIGGFSLDKENGNE